MGATAPTPPLRGAFVRGVEGWISGVNGAFVACPLINPGFKSDWTAALRAHPPAGAGPPSRPEGQIPDVIIVFIYKFEKEN